MLRDPVPVEVEDAWLDREARQARFLFRFAQRRARQVAVAIGVAAELQPQAELAVMGQQRARAIGGHQPRRSGEVAGEALADERIGGIIEQRQEMADDLGFAGPAAGVILESGGERPAVPDHADSAPARAIRAPAIMSRARSGADRRLCAAPRRL